jgi:hypothetical protein
MDSFAHLVPIEFPHRFDFVEAAQNFASAVFKVTVSNNEGTLDIIVTANALRSGT